MLRNATAPDLLELLDTGSAGDLDFYNQYARHCGGPVLVLMCGTGRVAISIARQGVPVMGLDAEAATVELARRKAVQMGATRAMFVQGNPAHFVSESKHPLVLIPGGGLLQLLTQEEQRACLMAIRQSLQVGGKLVLDLPLLDPERRAETGPVMRRAGDRVALLRTFRKFDTARQLQEELVECQWVDQHGMVVQSQCAVMSTRYATPGETVLLLEVCGFRTVCFGGFDRESLLPGATRLVIEAERNR
ncbi:MAG TPA: class I SAM-dependent methyltransferase [Symbiobacteriaceae bacterium]|nr:class I SAM-dependent methyltransferase [Symbiobacteriaceae bacterium]